jgi:hypothetical protein
MLSKFLSRRKHDFLRLKQRLVGWWKETSCRPKKTVFIPPPKTNADLPVYNIPQKGLFLDDVPDKDYILAKIVAAEIERYETATILYNCGLSKTPPGGKKTLCYN